MATVAFGALLLTVLVLLARPAPPLTARALPGAALQGARVLSRLSDRRRERVLGGVRDVQPAAEPARRRAPAPC